MRLLGIAGSVVYIAFCAYLLIFRLPDVQGNLEASIIWAAPIAVSHMIVHKSIKTIHTTIRNSNGEITDGNTGAGS